MFSMQTCQYMLKITIFGGETDGKYDIAIKSEKSNMVSGRININFILISNIFAEGREYLR